MKQIILFLLVLAAPAISAQQLPFASEIRAFKAADSVNMPPRNAIVFVGSSSFRMWHNVQEDFPDHTIINRGFGGSSLPHVIAYADDIIFAYKPKQVVIYCGENDFMTAGVTSRVVTDRFIELFGLIRKNLPDAHVAFVSMKPSPSRRHLMDEIAAANGMIRDFLKTKKRAAFVSIWNEMLDKEGNPRPELFLPDMLHMKPEGYAIWQKVLKPYLK